MKKLYTFLFFCFCFFAASAQEDDGPGGKVRERMAEYIEKRLGLSKSEARQFSPIYFNYLNDLRKATQDNKGDKLVLQQKVADLRLNYRNQFKNVVGDKRSNDVFNYERDFVDEVKRLRQERLQNNPGDNRRGKRN
jgi:hypothetical protein